jgi:ectoine hydroxylase-related dioxygenase (phytanoyl-CoA dioxygenase family)
MTTLRITRAQQDAFDRDGFVVVSNILAPVQLPRLHVCYERLFRGEFETGLIPDEVNWRMDRDDPSLTRQICNAWKADRALAAVVLREDIGQACALLGRWKGARLNQDNVFWKPPGARAIGFHQDSAYQDWAVPGEMLSCWIALDATRAEGGTVEYVRGSHRWGRGPKNVGFHAPDDPFADVRDAATAAGIDAPERVAIEVEAGDGVFHHGWTWHGSDTNRADVPRRSLVAHCMPADSQFHPSNVNPVYGRYKRFGNTDMDESFFPVLWREDGYRSRFIDSFVNLVPPG